MEVDAVLVGGGSAGGGAGEGWPAIFVVWAGCDAAVVMLLSGVADDVGDRGGERGHCGCLPRA